MTLERAVAGGLQSLEPRRSALPSAAEVAPFRVNSTTSAPLKRHCKPPAIARL